MDANYKHESDVGGDFWLSLQDAEAGGRKHAGKSVIIFTGFL